MPPGEFEMWVSAIKCAHARREDVSLAIVMVVFTLCISGWEQDRILDASLSLAVLHKVLRQGKPHIHHADKNRLFVGGSFTKDNL
jgi:hypothetical protein